MKLKHVYLILAIIGFVLPYSQFVLWVVENGLDFPLIIDQIVSSRISLTAWLDVTVTGIVLFVFIFTEKEKVSHLWAVVLGTLTVGVSLGLPLYLFLREWAREKRD